MTIEFLSADNLEEALDFAEKFHVESAWGDYPFKRDILKKNLIIMIDKPSYFTALYRSSGAIVGCWFGSLGSFLFSDVLFGMENGIFIAPEHRSGMCAFSMYKAFKKWCDHHGVEPICEIQFGDNDKAYTFFTRLGMLECGKIFRSKRYGMPGSANN